MYGPKKSYSIDISLDFLEGSHGSDFNLIHAIELQRLRWDINADFLRIAELLRQLIRADNGRLPED